MLEAYALGCRQQLVVADVLGPECENPRLFRIEVIALAVGEAPQYAHQGIAALFHATVSLLAADAGGHVDALVHHGELAIVVQHALVGAVLCEDRYPEIDVGL